MGLFARLKLGWSLSMDSLRVLRREPSLALFPLVAGAAGLVYLVGVNGLALVGGLLSLDGGAQPGVYVLVFVSYFGSTFIASFFSAALMYNAREVFRGNDPTLGDGLRAAWRNKGPLVVWSVIAATVGLVLRAVESNDSIVARVAAALFSVAWSILTYFIVPVIVFEEVGVTEMFKRSGETFTDTWGETAGAGFGVGVIAVVFVVIGLVLAAAVTFLLFQLNAVTGLVGGVIAFLAVVLLAYLLSSALTSIARTALYVYATTGSRPDGFEDVDFATPVA
jgi:hypothetical protein